MIKKVKIKKEAHWLNRGQAAKCLNLSLTAFDKWDVEPVARIGKEVCYEMRSIIQNRLDHQAKTYKPDPDELEGEGIDFERWRLTRAQADNMEIKNKIAEGNTAPIEIIHLVLSKISGEAAGELDSIPLNIKRKHPKISNQAIEDIKRHCVKAQNAISRTEETLDNLLDDYLTDLDAN